MASRRAVGCAIEIDRPNHRMDATLERIFVPAVPAAQRHALIFSTFDALPPGGAFEIVNDHDPVPLYLQFERTRAGQFDWRCLESGPAQWQARIGRVRAGSGCGGGGGCTCGGA
jgi:uncharacterized protein (DUF2249 family)